MSDTFTHPTEYDVIPRAWRVIDVPDGGKAVAALMPYPGRLAEDRACTGDPMFLDETALSSSTKRTRLQNICASCPVQTACREWAIAHEEFYFWGGTTGEDRRYMRRSRRQVLVDPHAAYVYGLREDPNIYVMSSADAED